MQRCGEVLPPEQRTKSLSVISASALFVDVVVHVLVPHWQLTKLIRCLQLMTSELSVFA